MGNSDHSSEKIELFTKKLEKLEKRIRIAVSKQKKTEEAIFLLLVFMIMFYSFWMSMVSIL